MDKLNKVFGSNLKEFRVNGNLSLDKVAQLTGVSKSMLGQIERGEANPTLSTVWKVANGLKISFSSLLQQEQLDTQLIRAQDVKPLSADNDKYLNYVYFPFEEEKKFEIYKLVMKQGANIQSNPHPEGVYEYIIVFQGQLTICINKEIYVLNVGDALKFKADQKHSYHNSESTEMIASEYLYYG